MAKLRTLRPTKRPAEAGSVVVATLTFPLVVFALGLTLAVGTLVVALAGDGRRTEPTHAPFLTDALGTAQPPAADKNCVAVFAASSGDLKQEQAHAGTRAAAVHFLKVSDC